MPQASPSCVAMGRVGAQLPDRAAILRSPPPHELGVIRRADGPASAGAELLES